MGVENCCQGVMVPSTPRAIRSRVRFRSHLSASSADIRDVLALPDNVVSVVRAARTGPVHGNDLKDLVEAVYFVVGYDLHRNSCTMATMPCLALSRLRLQTS